MLSDYFLIYYQIYNRRSRNPFECKDITLALTEIRELHDKIGELEGDKQMKIK